MAYLLVLILGILVGRYFFDSQEWDGDDWDDDDI